MKNISCKIILLVYLVFAILWIAFGPKKEATTPTPVQLITDARSYTLPKTPTVSLNNTTDAVITVDTCRDIQLVTNGVQK